MAPTPPIRRPVLGKGGAKRGVGLVVPKANQPKAKVQQTAAGEARPMKSNADFKAMFLSSNGAAKGEENGTAHS
jgi:squamous cell carcinoma antigen recognized by T-cells 3